MTILFFEDGGEGEREKGGDVKARCQNIDWRQSVSLLRRHSRSAFYFANATAHRTDSIQSVYCAKYEEVC